MGFYDNEVKRVCENCPRLLIMAVNSIFKKAHNINQEVIYLDKELNLNSSDNPQFLDKLIEIEDSKYHIEFQLLEGKMAVRMYEYAVKETVRTLPEDADKYEIDVVMPHQAVIFLAGANKKTEITVNLTLPDEQKVSYTIRCISASETVEYLCEEKLYILLPFQQVQLNDRMNRLTENSREATRKKLALEIVGYRKAVLDKLEKLIEDSIIKVNERDCLMEAVSNVENYIRSKDSGVSEEVKSMGDENYVAWSDRLRSEGEELNCIKLVCKKIVKNKTLEEIVEDLEEEYKMIKPIYDEALKHAPEYNPKKIYEALHSDLVEK